MPKQAVLKSAQVSLCTTEERALTHQKRLRMKNERASCSIRGMNGTGLGTQSQAAIALLIAAMF